MSARATALVWSKFPVGGNQLLLALALADQATDSGDCILLDIVRLSKKTRLAERGVREQLRAMADAGLLEQMEGAKAFRFALSWMGAAPGAEAPERAARAVGKRGQRLAQDWILPEDWKAWALAQFPAWTPAWVAGVAERFKDHWTAASGQGASKVDWSGTWRNWCRKEPAAPPVAQAAAPGGEWWKSQAAIVRKGSELCVAQIDGEPWMAWRDRIFRAAGDGPWIKMIYQAPDPTGGGVKNAAQAAIAQIKELRGMKSGTAGKV